MILNRVTCCVALAVLLSACTGSSPTDPANNSVIIITNSWEDEADSTHFFALVSDDDGRSSGSFTGTETAPDGSEFDVAGSWAQGNISFVSQRDASVTYRATFTTDNPTRLQFSSSAGALVLVQSS